MILRFNVTPKDYEDMICSDLKARLGFLKSGCLPIAVLLLFLPGILLSIMGGARFDSGMAVPVMILAAVAAFVFVFTNARCLAKMTVWGRLRSGEIAPGFFGLQTVELLDDRLLISYGGIRGERLYAYLSEVKELDGAVAMFVGANTCDLIPRSAFGNAEERNSFVNLLQARIAGAAGALAEPASALTPPEQAGARYALEYSWEREPFIDALAAGNRLMYQTKLMWTPGRILLCAISLYLLTGAFIGIARLLFAPNAGEAFVTLTLAPILLALLIAAILQTNLIMTFTPWIKSALRGQFKSGAVPKDAAGPHKLYVRDDKLTLTSALSSQDHAMGQIYCLKQNEDALFLFLKGRRIIALPLSAFRSEGELREVAEFIESKITKS